MDLTSIFKGLPKPDQGDLQSFSAAQIEGTAHKVGRDISGWPVLLLSTTSGQNGPQIRLEHLEVQPSIHCRVTSGKNIEEGIFTVIRCTNADEELAVYFFNSIEPVLRTLGSNPTPEEVARAIAHLVELFRAMAQAPIKSVSGLWAELFVIRNVRDPIALLNSWHSTPEEKYDFNTNIQRLEVKSASSRNRTHHFSLEQLIPPSGCRVVIASLFVEKSGGGTSLRDLTQEIKNLLVENPELEEKVDRVIAQTLGNTLRQSMNNRFDRQLAQESLKFFDADVIPKISESLPASISDVHFRVDIGGCQELSRQALVDMGGLFAVLLI
jgi:hypothetical protein